MTYFKCTLLLLTMLALSQALAVSVVTFDQTVALPMPTPTRQGLGRFWRRRRQNHQNEQRRTFKDRQATHSTLLSPPVVTEQTEAAVRRRATNNAVTDIYHHFASALRQADDTSSYEIDTENLLHALHHVEHTMRQSGQKTNAKDLHNNIAKIETMYHSAPKGQRETMAALLNYEKSRGLHEPSGILSESSAAMGLLWCRRSIAFQHALYSRVLQGVDTKEAAHEAYRQELEQYHGWALRRIAMMALRATIPPKRELLAQLSGVADANEFGVHDEVETEKELHHLLSVWSPLLTNWRQLYTKTGLGGHPQSLMG